MHRLWCGNGRIGVTHGGHRNKSTFQNDGGFDTKESRLPNDQVGPFTHFHTAHFMANAVRNRGVDGVFGNVAFDPEVVMPIGVAWQFATLQLHFVRSLPSTNNDFAHTAHRLTV